MRAITGFRLGLLAAGVGLGLFAEWASLQRAPFEPASGTVFHLAAADFVVGAAFVACGVLLWWLRPESWVGLMFAATGFTWFLGTFSLSGQSRYSDFGSSFVTLHRGPLVHALLTFPTGRPESRIERAVIALAYVCAAVPDVGGNDEVTIVVALLVMFVAARRYAGSRGPRRRARLVATACTAAFSTVLVVDSVAGLTGAGIDQGLIWAYEAVLFGITIALTVDLARSDWTRTTVAGLVVDLGRLGEAGTLRDRLADALGDRSLALGYWISERELYADDVGRPLELPRPGSGREATFVRAGDDPVAVLVHDESVLADRELVDDVAAAAQLAVANARLQAEIRRQIGELEASRRRIVEAGDAQRRRLERELHEGAEARLVSVKALLELERGDADDSIGGLLDGTSAELDRAQSELMELARGIHPRVLTDGGLAAALRDLSARAPFTVEAHAPDERFPAPVEVAAYFVCSEALANCAKYAGATRATVDVSAEGGALVVTVTDDGRGGASVESGSGLRGLADRVETLGGRLTVESPPGQGTCVRAELPLT